MRVTARSGRGATLTVPQRTDQRPRIAITIDDPHLRPMGGIEPQELDQRIRGALRELGASAVLFVCGMRVPGEDGAKLLSAWAREGHVLGNHSFSHRDLHSPDIQVRDWLEDVVLGEEVIHGYPTFRKLFRYPRSGSRPCNGGGAR